MYLSITESEFGFKHPEANEIISTDIEISDEVYNKYFELKALNKQFKIKNINGKTFEEIFEEFIPEPVPQPVQPTTQDLQKQIFDLTTQLVIGGVI